jgi:hypothetical protein
VTGRLLQRQDEECIFESSVKVVKSLTVNYALRDRDFQHIWDLVKRVGSPGMPGKTMESVKAAIEGYGDLTKFEAAVKGQGEALDKVESDLGKVEERLNTSTKAFAEASSQIGQLAAGFQATVREAFETAMENSKGFESEAISALRTISSETSKKFEAQRAEASQSLTSTAEQGRQKIQGLVEQCNALVESIRKAAETERQQHREQLEEYGELKAQVGFYSSDIQRATVLLAIEADPEALKIVGKDTVMRLLYNIRQWSKVQTWSTPPRAERSSVFGSSIVYSKQFVEFEKTLQWALTTLSKGKTGG